MRVQGIVILLAAFGAAEAQASSIETAPPLAGPASSIVTLGGEAAIDPSIVAAVSDTGPSPSIITVPDTPATPSIITLGVPAPADEATAAAPSSQGQAAPTVIRGGEVGSASPRPLAAPTQAAPSGEPLLDPNDKGTPAKRKALKRQAERLAREAAEAEQNPQPDRSTEPAPLGQ
jgi:hypothetical protein